MAVNITLAGSTTFISAKGKIYHKGTNYKVSKEESVILLAAKDDYEVPYFSKLSEDAVTQEAESVPESPVPTVEEVAKSINDPTPSDSTAEQGEIDTAVRRVGRPAKVAV